MKLLAANVVEIREHELLADIERTIECIRNRTTVYRVLCEQPIFTGAACYFLIPLPAPRSWEEVYDAEYGWPKFIEIDDIVSEDQLRPARRCHPIIIEKPATAVAAAVNPGEFEELYAGITDGSPAKG
ncbi:MAG: hypothetical protein EVA65_10100 [Oceanococcus sp.]|nr:MAG: hypothetical protein EVA65_10100 [Oceanococcus sp.]